MEYFIEREKKYKVTIIIIMFIMLIIGLITVFKYNNYFLLGDLNKLDNDDVRYFNTARYLIENRVFIYSGTEPTTFIMPGYPFFLVLIRKIFGLNLDWMSSIRVVQILLQCVSMYLVYLISRTMFNKKVGIIAMILTTLYLPEYEAANFILTEVLYKNLYLFLFYFSILAIKENKTKYYFMGGLFWTVACLIRPNAAAFPLFILIFWVVNKYSIKDMLKYSFIVAIIFIILFSPWWIRNYKVTNNFVLFTQSSSNPKLLGSLIRWEWPSFGDEIPKEYKYDKFVESGNGRNLSEEDQGKLADYIIKTGFEKEPLKYLKWFTIGKTIELYKDSYYWRPIFNITEEAANYQQTIYVFMGLLGFIAMLIRRKKGVGMLLILLSINTIIYLPFITFSRYGYPNMFIFIIGGAYLLEIVTNKK